MKNSPLSSLDHFAASSLTCSTIARHGFIDRHIMITERSVETGGVVTVKFDQQIRLLGDDLTRPFSGSSTSMVIMHNSDILYTISDSLTGKGYAKRSHHMGRAGQRSLGRKVLGGIIMVL